MNHLGTLRVSLLLAIGVVPIACGGTFRRGNNDDEGSSSGSGGSAGSRSGGRGGTVSTGTSGGPSKAGGPGKMLPPTGGTDAGGTGAGGVGVSFPPTCTNPRYDSLSGLQLCDEGYSIRNRGTQCEGLGGLGPVDEGSGGAAGDGSLPRADDDTLCGDFAQGGGNGADVCDQFEDGYCDAGRGDPPSCRSGCVTDGECVPGALCECGHAESPTGGVCRPTTCWGPEDCKPGAACASFEGLCGSGGYACFAPDDECTTSKDCAFGVCNFDQTRGHRYCDNAVCGRPFLIDDAARVAGVVASRDWNVRVAMAPRLEHLSAAERDALAQHWTRLGQLEHASIAAFARFSLQLLSLGAPPELVAACTRALGDETAHTQLCFGLASAYAGRPIGPGKLDIDGSLRVSSLVEVVELVILEGCFGETVAALEAREAAEGAADPVIRSAYTQIAVDEQRHAELAFQFVRWALQQDRAGVSACIEAARHHVQARPDVLTAVVEPCFTALLARAA